MIPLVNTFLDACQVWRQRHQNQPLDMRLQQLIVKIFLCVQRILITAILDTVRKKIGDGSYRVYTFFNPPVVRTIEVTRQRIHPRVPSIAETMAEKGEYFGNKPPIPYVDGKEIIEGKLAASDPDNDTPAMRYARENIELYNDPEFRMQMARRFFEDQIAENQEQLSVYESLVRQICQEELNLIWWEYKTRRDENARRERSIFQLIMSQPESAEPVYPSTEQLAAIDQENPPKTLEEIYGRPEIVEEIKENRPREQTREEHRNEWDEMRLTDKVTKTLCVDGFSKSDWATMVATWAICGSAMCAVKMMNK